MNQNPQKTFLNKTLANTVLALFLIAVGFFHSGCETTSSVPSVMGVGHEFDSSFDFDIPETFAIVRPESGSPMSPILRRNILTETAAQLTEMGYREISDPAKADAKTKELVWREWGTRRFTLESEVTSAQIKESVRRLLRSFPPERKIG